MGEETQQLLERVQAALEGDDAGLANALIGVRSEDVAEVFGLLDIENQSRLIFALPPRAAAEVVALLDEAERGDFIEDLPDEKLTEIVSELPPDDAADVLSELDTARSDGVLEQVSDDHAAAIEDLLQYDPESAGGIMTPDVVALPETATVREAVRHLRDASEGEDLHEIYVVDDQERLVGIVPLRRLVTTPKDTPLSDLGAGEPISIRADADQEDVVRLISKYDLAALPVADEQDRLIGRITHDDIMDVAADEYEEDLYRMAGTDPSEQDTTSSFRAARIRLTWLLPCMLIMTGTATAISLSEAHFAAAVYGAIIAFVPMVGAMSGNCGVQISTVIVRGLATGELGSSRIQAAFRREGSIVFVMAPICGLVAAIISRYGLPLLLELGHIEGAVDARQVAFAVGFGMTAAILIAGVLGVILPFTFRRFGIDPAIASGPIVTTVNDVVSVSIYLLIAVALMGGD